MNYWLSLPHFKKMTVAGFGLPAGSRTEALHFKFRTKAKLLAFSSRHFKKMTVAGLEPATRGL